MPIKSGNTVIRFRLAVDGSVPFCANAAAVVEIKETGNTPLHWRTTTHGPRLLLSRVQILYNSEDRLPYHPTKVHNCNLSLHLTPVHHCVLMKIEIYAWHVQFAERLKKVFMSLFWPHSNESLSVHIHWTRGRLQTGYSLPVSKESILLKRCPFKISLASSFASLWGRIPREKYRPFSVAFHSPRYYGPTPTSWSGTLIPDTCSRHVLTDEICTWQSVRVEALSRRIIYVLHVCSRGLLSIWYSFFSLSHPTQFQTKRNLTKVA